MPEQTTLFGTSDVARQFNVTTDTVNRWIESGLLKAQKIGRDWIITEDDLKAFQPPRRGRPPDRERKRRGYLTRKSKE